MTKLDEVRRAVEDVDNLSWEECIDLLKQIKKMSIATNCVCDPYNPAVRAAPHPECPVHTKNILKNF